jgi:hypothetical protein
LQWQCGEPKTDPYHLSSMKCQPCCGYEKQIFAGLTPSPFLPSALKIALKNALKIARMSWKKNTAGERRGEKEEKNRDLFPGGREREREREREKEREKEREEEREREKERKRERERREEWRMCRRRIVPRSQLPAML